MALRVRAVRWPFASLLETLSSQLSDAGDSRRGASLALLLAIAALVYIAATLVTEPNFIADAPEYARAVAASRCGVDCQFLEFGHLAWRPLGRAMLDLFVRPRGDELLSLHALQQLSRAALVCGLLGVLAAAAWLHLQVRSFRAAAFGVVCLIMCKAYLNFSQVGSPYIPGVSAMFAGLLLAALEPRRPFARGLCDVTAGVCFAVSALFWGTYALAVPGAVLAPLVLKSDWRAELPRVLRCGTTGVVVLGVVYLLVGHAVGLRSAADYRAWIGTSSHGIAGGGFSRAVIGFARSFVDVGDYGRLVKRYLTKDPFNPVAVRDLLSLPLAKIAGFYLAMAVLAGMAALQPIGRRALGLAALMALPVFVFAVRWQGGDLQRYLPALPALVLVGAAAFQNVTRPALQSALTAGLVIVATANLLAVSTTAARGADTAAEARLAGSDYVSVDRAVFVVSHWQDDLMTFNHNRPFHELNLKGLSVYPLVSPGTAEVPMWRQLAAASMLMAWGEGKRVFVSSRLFAVTPERAWNWIETDDDRVTWRDFGAFFRTAELAAPAALATEFRELMQTERNRRMLMDVVWASVPGTSSTADTAATLSNYLMAAAGACRVDGTRAPGSSRAAR